MGRYALSRLVHAIPTIIGISILTFVAMRLIGDPAALVLGEQATQEALEAYRREQGLDRPIFVQYVDFIRSASRGDFGNSLRYREPVVDLIVERLPATLQLGAAALLLATVFGISLGAASALRRGKLGDQALRGIALVGQGVPGFFLGLLLIIVFGVHLNWLPTGGTGGLRHVVLPAIALASYQMALVFRFTRSSMLDVLSQDYIRTARAKGLRSMTVVVRHALKNALIPIVTVIGLQTGVLVSGAVVTETVFSWPGLGRFIVEAVQARDYPVLQAALLFIAVLVVCINLAVDIAYAFIDPRVRFR